LKCSAGFNLAKTSQSANLETAQTGNWEFFNLIKMSTVTVNSKRRTENGERQTTPRLPCCPSGHNAIVRFPF